MKFGGTSVKDAEAMSKVIKIISDYKKEKAIVVLSACSGITDKLIALVTNAPTTSLNKSQNLIDEIESHHLSVIKNIIKVKTYRDAASIKVLNFTAELKRLIEGVQLLKECTARNIAQAESYGELLSTTIFHYGCLSKSLKSEFADARAIMKTDSNYINAKVDMNLISKNAVLIKKAFSKNDFVITQGFIGSDKKGITTTLGRGGSDFSAAVFGAAVKAKEIQIWTDVSGVLTTDPRLDKRAKTISEISNAEMRELAFYGAKVLHPDTIKPAVEKKIPVRILNTYKPKDRGTVILDNPDKSNSKYHSVILKKNCTEMIVPIPSDVSSQKFFSENINQLTKLNAKILYSICTEGNCRFILDPGMDKKSLKSAIEIDYMRIHSVSLICITGNNIYLDENKNDLIRKKFLTELNALKPKQIIYGASNVSVLILTEPEDGLNTLKKLHSFILRNF